MIHIDRGNDLASGRFGEVNPILLVTDLINDGQGNVKALARKCLTIPDNTGYDHGKLELLTAGQVARELGGQLEKINQSNLATFPALAQELAPKLSRALELFEVLVDQGFYGRNARYQDAIADLQGGFHKIGRRISAAAQTTDLRPLELVDLQERIDRTLAKISQFSELVDTASRH